MTRFARAKGSKSSNERQPEEASSWQGMKQQLLEKQKLPNTNEAEEKTKFYFDTKANETNWAEFEESKNGSVENITIKNKKGKNFKSRQSIDPFQVEDISSVQKSSSAKKEKVSAEIHNLNNDGVSKRKRRKRKAINNAQKVAGSNVENESQKNKDVPVHSAQKSTEIDNLPEDETSKGFTSKNKRKQKKNKNFEPGNAGKYVNSNIQNESRKRKGSNTKINDVQKKRRKLENGSFKLFINGQEIEVTYFGGFPVKKEDAERLKELRKKMIAEGIPTEQISSTMKLERRKAEKALTREKKRVCFHCRKSGHVLSECPELGNSNTSNTGMGICFKCGSTEHTHFQCKVVHNDNFRYAQCFICKEEGHIARQCPDNPRGLYPKGGGCNVCGDVTHLKKDCPKLIAMKEEETIRLETLNASSLEALDEDIKEMKSMPAAKEAAKKKIVKF